MTFQNRRFVIIDKFKITYDCDYDDASSDYNGGNICKLQSEKLDKLWKYIKINDELLNLIQKIKIEHIGGCFYTNMLFESNNNMILDHVSENIFIIYDHTHVVGYSNYPIVLSTSFLINIAHEFENFDLIY